jgi:hypothetical protein
LYLGCYLGLADDDRCCVLEDDPLPRHLVTRVEELIQIGAVALERLATLLRHGVEGGLDDVVLVKVGSVDVRASTTTEKVICNGSKLPSVAISEPLQMCRC